MDLFLPLDGWQLSQKPKGTLYRRPQLGLLASRLMAYPEDPQAWFKRALQDDVPPRATVAILGTTAVTTLQGWPAIMASAEMTMGEQREARVAVLYRFLDYGAGVIIRGDAAAFAAQRDEILSVLQRAEPRWTAPDQVVSLAQLFDGIVKPADASTAPTAQA